MRKSAVLLTIVLVAFQFAGCGKKARHVAKPSPTPTPVAADTPIPKAIPVTPTPTPTPTPVVEANKNAEVVVLCYHRFEEKSKEMVTKPEEFEAQMQMIKDRGLSVISMEDFLAWRRNEKAIPEKSVVITLDDGWATGYTVAWPILRKFNYPFTMFIYTNYVKGGSKAGGQSLSWEQLAEMRDAGVDIESHTVSHSDLRAAKRNKTPEQYDAYLQTELGQSKEIIESNLGIEIKALAYPYGNYSPAVREIGKKVGYEAMFTVYGQKIGFGGPSDIIGRYAVDSIHPEIFQSAISFAGGPATSTASAGMITEVPAVGQLAATSIVTEPASGATITDPKPVVKANLATLGKLDPASVEMRISGFGMVPAQYDGATQTITYTINRKLQPRDYTVIISGKANGQKVETRWSFKYAGE